jgi:hypothetical protein
VSNELEHNHPQFDEAFQPSSPEPKTCPACFWENNRRRPIMRTVTNKVINPLDLRPEDIDIRDIAHHLACINRWVGALREPISVAQHSVYVSRLVREDQKVVKLQALLHDATEAYLGDVSKWVKMSDGMAAYREVEKRAHAVIMQRFNLPEQLHPEVEHYDRMMINIEGAFGFDNWLSMPGFPVPTPADLDRLCWMTHRVVSWNWQLTKKSFLRRFEDLGGQL